MNDHFRAVGPGIDHLAEGRGLGYQVNRLAMNDHFRAVGPGIDHLAEGRRLGCQVDRLAMNDHFRADHLQLPLARRPLALAAATAAIRDLCWLCLLAVLRRSLVSHEEPPPLQLQEGARKSHRERSYNPIGKYRRHNWVTS
jgi:hypothetical protein